MNIGFLGTGAIASDMVTGLCSVAGWTGPVFVSARSLNRSSALAEKYDCVSVETDNQQLVDKCDVVFVSVLPGQARQVLERLKFAASQTVVSLVAGFSVEQIKAMVEPAAKVLRIIPLPPIAKCLGPIPLFPPPMDAHDEKVIAFLEEIGKVIPVSDESQFTTFSSASAVMATWFEMIASVATWMESRGVDAESAASYASNVSLALASMTTDADSSHLKNLSDECLTVGGLNEQVLLELREQDWFKQLGIRLDRIAIRLEQN